MLLLLAVTAHAAPLVGATCEGPLPQGLDAPRPELSGEVLTRDVGEGFRLHWTEEGEDAADPDLLDWAEAEWEAVTEALAERPWRALVGDDGTGGSAAIDAYVVDIDANGYANAVTPAAGEDGASCFVRFDPGIADLGETIARSIVRHELYHCVQYRYSIDSHPWMYESHATFEQYRPAPAAGALELLTNILWGQRISEPDRPLDDVGDRFEYAGFMWFKHLEEDGVPPWEVWEALEAEPRWQDGLDGLGGLALEERSALVEVWDQGVCGRAGQTSESYGVEGAGCTAPVEAPRRAGVSEDLSWDTQTLPAWTTRAVEVTPLEAAPDGAVARVGCSVDSGRVGVALDAPDMPVELGLLDADGASTAQLVLADPADVALLVLAAGEEPTEGSCVVTWVEPETAGGCGCASASTGAGSSAFILLLGVLGLARRRRRS